MSQNTPRVRQTTPEYWEGRENEHRRKIAATANAALYGQTNNQFTVILEPNATETTILYEKSRPDISVNLTPGSLSAAMSVGVWVEPATGSAKIHHDSSTATDRKFFAVFVG